MSAGLYLVVYVGAPMEALLAFLPPEDLAAYLARQNAQLEKAAK